MTVVPIHRWPLRYVCAWCACDVATFPHVASTAPAVLTVCDRPDCRAQASAEWKAAL